MRKNRFTESQIVAIRKEADSGIPVKDLVRKHGVSVPTYYQWKSKYGGMDVAELVRVRELGTAKGLARPAASDPLRPRTGVHGTTGGGLVPRPRHRTA